MKKCSRCRVLWHEDYYSIKKDGSPYASCNNCLEHMRVNRAKKRGPCDRMAARPVAEPIVLADPSAVWLTKAMMPYYWESMGFYMMGGQE